MKFTTKTEYGLVCLIHMAKHQDKPWITTRDIVKDEKLSPTYVEKILQKFKQAGIVHSQQGNQGGHALAKKASEITLREIIEAVEGATFDVYCKPKFREAITCNHFIMCSLRPVWEKTKNLLDDFYGSVTLETIVKQEPEVRAAVV